MFVFHLLQEGWMSKRISTVIDYCVCMRYLYRDIRVYYRIRMGKSFNTKTKGKVFVILGKGFSIPVWQICESISIIHRVICISLILIIKSMQKFIYFNAIKRVAVSLFLWLTHRSLLYESVRSLILVLLIPIVIIIVLFIIMFPICMLLSKVDKL